VLYHSCGFWSLVAGRIHEHAETVAVSRVFLMCGGEEVTIWKVGGECKVGEEFEDWIVAPS
jgi:hypothetical protein